MRGQNMKTPYRILKLKSGEDIIATIRGQVKNKLILERPMCFATRIIIDPYSGKQRELTILKNWLPHTNEIQTKIPKDFIATYITPDSDVIKLYNLEKEKEDINDKKKKIIDMKHNNMNHNDMMNNLDLNENMEKIKNMFEFMQDLKSDSFTEEMGNLFSEEEKDIPENNNFKNFISLSIMLPPEALLSLVDADILDVEDVQDLIETLNNKDRGNKNYGNRWKDWPADPDDYLEE